MRNFFQKIFQKQSGFSFLLVIVVTGFFLIFFSGMISLSLVQKKLYTQQVAKQQALHVAEAGVNYYVWRLAHNSQDFFDGHGDPGGINPPYGPYEHEFDIPNSDLKGFFSLMIHPPESGNNIVTIVSEGWLSSFPNARRTIEAKYGTLSLGNYSFLTNSDVWFGSKEKTVGRVHSNGGVRMDGLNDSLVTSARDTYICSSSHACYSYNCPSSCEQIGASCRCPGVWGRGPDNNLWSYPVSVVDFESITFNIAEMKGHAQADGYFFPKSSPGYHIIFKEDGSFDAYKINRLKSSLSQLDDDWNKDENISEQIDKEVFIGNYLIPDNGLIFIEDDVWVEGIINGRATLVSAVLPGNENTHTTIHINDNLRYLERDGVSILGLIAQKNIKVPFHAPSNLTIDAVMLAQYGRVFRNQYKDQVIKEKIEVFGSIITNKIWTWTWVDNFGLAIDGYRETNSIYDPRMNDISPPFFPTLGSHQLVSWREY